MISSFGAPARKVITLPGTVNITGKVPKKKKKAGKAAKAPKAVAATTTQALTAAGPSSKRRMWLYILGGAAVLVLGAFALSRRKKGRRPFGR